MPRIVALGVWLGSAGHATGEMNYANIFSHLKRKGFTGVVGVVHGTSKPGAEGEVAVVAASLRLG